METAGDNNNQAGLDVVHEPSFSLSGVTRPCRRELQRHFVTVTGDVTRPPPDDPKVLTTEDRAMAAGHSVDMKRWRQEFDMLMLQVDARFARVELWRRPSGACWLGRLQPADSSD
jgi:hypothetical protein